MIKLKIITAPHPTLNKIANIVNEVDASIRTLMDGMHASMLESNGIGLAANQVNILKRVMVIDLQDESSEYKNIMPLKMANVEIIEESETCVDAEEGCLSLPEQLITVSRPEKIRISYLDYDNVKQELSASGLLARAIQHELDHLNGKLLINYLSNLKKHSAIKKLTKLKKLSA